MTKPDLTLAIMAAGRSTRFGDIKQLARVGPCGEALMDYSAYDALRCGFKRIVVVTSADLRKVIEDHVRSLLPDVPVEIVIQEMPSHRSKPWGTGHAVLAVNNAIRGPFAICNADDFYGRGAFQSLFQHLTSTRPTRTPHHAVVGYTLGETLTEKGGVSRAVCEMTHGRQVDRITEIVDIRQEAGRVTGRRTDGTQVSLAGTEMVSMNLWGFDTAVLAELETQFEDFRTTFATEQHREFYLSDALNQQIARGSAMLQCLSATEEWFGMTYATDRDFVRARIMELVDTGTYPDNLRLGPDQLTN